MYRLLIFFFVITVSGTSLGSLYSYEKLDYKMYPLIQNGGMNVSPPINNSLKDWNAKGDVTYIGIEGKKCLRLNSIQNNKSSSITFSAHVVPNTLYTVSFNFCFTEDAKFNYGSHYPGLHGWVVIFDEKGKEVSSWRILEQRNLVAWGNYNTNIYTTQFGSKIRFSISFNGNSGHALISDITICADEISKEENKMVISPLKGNVGYEYGEVVSVTKNAIRQLDKAIVFSRSDPDNLFFYTRPTLEEINKPIIVALTPGEVGISTIAICAPQKLSKVKLMILELKNKEGKKYSGHIDWNVVHYRPRRVNYAGRGRTWRWVADSFHDVLNGIDINEDQAVVFWLKIRASPEALPGIYHGNAVLETAEGQRGLVPIEVKVRPFRLVDTGNKIFGLYADYERWKSLSDEQIIRELNDFKMHGINCILIPSGRPLLLNNKIAGWRFAKQDERYMRLIVQSKLGNSFVAWFGWLDKWLAYYFNVSAEELKKDPSQWPAHIKDAYIQCLILFKKEYDSKGWGEPIFHAVDEPGYWKKGSPEQFVWKYKTANDVGLKTYCTSSYLPDDPLGKSLAYHCYGKKVLINPEYSDFVLQKTHAAGQKFWYYATGSYSGQIGNMVKNRYLSGFIFFKSRADGLMSWTFQRPRGNPFDDFYAGKTGQPCITYPDPKNPGVYLDTPQWEGLRQGWIDFKYVSTLAELAKKSTEAKKELKRILDSMPWNGDPFQDNEVTNIDCDTWREEISKAIERYSF